MVVTTVHGIQSLVRGRRTALKKTQSALAQDAGVSRKWVSDFERGVSISVELPQLLKVLAALDLDVDIAPRSAEASRQPGANDGDSDLDEILEKYASKGD